jgi:hypothetical protein
MTDRRWLAGRWRGVYDVDRPADWCRGCGYYRAIHGAHRADCTAVTPPRCECGAELVLLRSRALGWREECAVAGETSGEPISEQEAIATVRSVFPGARIISTGPIAQHPKMSAGHGGEKGSEMNIHYHLVSRIIPTSATDSTEEVL